MIALTRESSRFVESVDVPIAVALIGFAGALAAAAMSFALSRLSERASRRRECYAAATRQLVAFLEYPYRIRRRTSDKAEELARLADVGHEIQESLQYHETWVAAESRWAGEVFGSVRADLSADVGPACNEAWAASPITSAIGMNLSGWGPNGAADHIRRFERAVTWRFGWRRVLTLFRPHRP